MFFALLAVIGFFVGYRLAMSRAGYVTMALVTVAFSVGQLVHLFLTKNREAMTMLPLVIGVVLVLFMLLGALTRLSVRRRSNAA
jgi:uncharacterized membrane protein